MTIEQLTQKVEELEKRIIILENQRPIINVYPNYQPPVTAPNLQFPYPTYPVVYC